MAIYFPELYCPKGTILEAIKNIELRGFTISKGQKCYVYDIKGYGFDINLLWDKSKLFRVNNSEMGNYFIITLMPERETLDMDIVSLKVHFIKDYKIDDCGTKIRKGEKFYAIVNEKSENKVKKVFYDLYNIYRKVLRLNEAEAKEYLAFNSL